MIKTKWLILTLGAVALIMLPTVGCQKTQETTGDLNEMAADGMDQAGDMAEKGMDKAGDMAEKGMKKAGEMVDDATQKTGEMMEDAKEKEDEGGSDG